MATAKDEGRGWKGKDVAAPVGLAERLERLKAYADEVERLEWREWLKAGADLLGRVKWLDAVTDLANMLTAAPLATELILEEWPLQGSRGAGDLLDLAVDLKVAYRWALSVKGKMGYANRPQPNRWRTWWTWPWRTWWTWQRGSEAERMAAIQAWPAVARRSGSLWADLAERLEWLEAGWAEEVEGARLRLEADRGGADRGG